SQPSREAHVPVAVLARAPAGPRSARSRLGDAHGRQGNLRTRRKAMTTETVGGETVEVDDEGFFVDADTWSERMAPELAAQEGIDELTDRHWQVIRFMRREYAEKG